MNSPTPSPPPRSLSDRPCNISIDVPSPEPMQRQHATVRQDCRLDEQPDITARRIIERDEADYQRSIVVESAITRQLYEHMPSAANMLSAQQNARIRTIVTRLYEWHQKALMAPDDRWSAKSATKLCKFPELTGFPDYEHLIIRLRDLGYRPFVRAHALYIRLPNCQDQTPIYGCAAPVSDDNN